MNPASGTPRVSAGGDIRSKGERAMPDKEELKSIVELARNSRTILESSSVNAKCCCPTFIEYYVVTDCVTINNGACPTWDFCRSIPANS